MEKLHSDMLEMILTQPTKRLNERQTKFLIYQVELRDMLDVRTTLSLGSRSVEVSAQQIHRSLWFEAREWFVRDGSVPREWCAIRSS